MPLREIHRHQPADASKFCFLIDGPLSINGEPARIHSSIMRDYFRISSDLISRNLKPPLVFGLTKTGRVVEHFRKLMTFCLPIDYFSFQMNTGINI